MKQISFVHMYVKKQIKKYEYVLFLTCSLFLFHLSTFLHMNITPFKVLLMLKLEKKSSKNRKNTTIPQKSLYW